jgi:WD40 repeat protein
LSNFISLIKTSSFDNSVKKWSLETGECIKTKQFDNDYIKCIKLVAYDLIAVGVSNGDILIYDTNEYKIIFNFTKHTNYISSIEFLSNGDLVTRSENGQIRLRKLNR